MKLVCSLFAIAALATLSGCATVVNGRTEPLGLSSNPSGAEVTVDHGAMKVLTPTTVTLKRDEDHTFVFRKAGYKTASATVTSTTSGWVWGNVLLGGIVGGVVDFADGAAYKFSNDNLSVNLTPISPSKPASKVAALKPSTSSATEQSQPATSKASKNNPAGGVAQPSPGTQQLSEQTTDSPTKKQ